MFEKVLIPTDLSEQSESIVARVRRMKNIREIILLHILTRNSTAERRIRVPQRSLWPAPHGKNSTTCGD